jgi:hypothetical protein
MAKSGRLTNPLKIFAWQVRPWSAEHAAALRLVVVAVGHHSVAVTPESPATSAAAGARVRT